MKPSKNIKVPLNLIYSQKNVKNFKKCKNNEIYVIIKQSYIISIRGINMILSVEEIQKSYGKEKVLHGVSIRIHQPEIVALVGPNGSGKSTLLGIVTNLISPDHGKVKILNRTNKDPEIFRYVSFMQDNSVLYDYLTGYDHLQFIGDVQGISKGQILSAAERVGMESYLHKKLASIL